MILGSTVQKLSKDMEAKQNSAMENLLKIFLSGMLIKFGRSISRLILYKMIQVTFICVGRGQFTLYVFRENQNSYCQKLTLH